VTVLEYERDTVEKVLEIGSDPWVLKRLVESMAPDLYSLKVVKEALLYFLLGGVSEDIEERQKRGSIHLLIVGDPGTGKSELLRFAKEVAPKSLMVTGNYTDTDSLVVSSIQNGLDRIDAAPGALIQMNDGILAIDRIDQLDQGGRAALIPVMAEQKITVATNGVIQTFPAATSIIASANPTLGRYNPYQTIAQNLSLSIPLLSCFDLIFMIRDIPDSCKDRRTAEHILFLERRLEPKSGKILSVQDLQAYIDYARKLKPSLSHEVAQRLVNFYVEMRSASLEGGEAAAISITVRQLEALVRIAESRAKAHLRSEVLMEDATAAINLMNRSLEQVGIDVETGIIDLDILYTGRPRSLNVRLFKVMATIEELEKVEGIVKDEELWDILYADYSMSRRETARLVSKLLREGTIYSPKPGFYKRNR
jgi:replicative DNA helicase Mcm